MEKGGLIRVQSSSKTAELGWGHMRHPGVGVGWDLIDPVARASLQCGVARGKVCAWHVGWGLCRVRICVRKYTYPVRRSGGSWRGGYGTLH